MPNGTILCVDQRFSDWFGRSPAEIVGKPFACLARDQQELQQVGTCLAVLPRQRPPPGAPEPAALAAVLIGGPRLGQRDGAAAVAAPTAIMFPPRHPPPQVLDLAERAGEEDFARGLVGARGVCFVHKYTAGVQVDVAVEMGGGGALAAAAERVCC
jgi:hypothetical protein